MYNALIHNNIIDIISGHILLLFSGRIEPWLFPIIITGISTIVLLIIREKLKSRTIELEKEIKDTKGILKQHTLLRALIDNMPDYIYVKDTDCKFIIANTTLAESMGTASAQELIGKTDFDFHPRKLAEKYFRDEQEILRSGNAMVNREEIIKDHNKQTKWLLTTKVPVRDNNGKLSAIVGIGRDITSRKNQERQIASLNHELEEKNKELGAILYVASHDLRSPLLNIQGFSRELEESCGELAEILQQQQDSEIMRKKLHSILDEDLPESLSYILTSTAKMDTLLSGLLRLSRLGHAALNMEKLEMNSMAEEILKSLQYRIKESGAEIKISRLQSCLGDYSQINQVFSNILDNAIKYLDPSRQGLINVSSEEEGEFIRYCIEDNGIGIEPHHQEKIFEIFHQLNPDSRKGGEGLGLTIVKRILSRHNGKITLQSKPGQGTRFYILLPSAD